MSEVTMSSAKTVEVKDQTIVDDQVDGDKPVADDDLTISDKVEENPMPSPQEEEEIIKRKYGGIVPKKPPLISKDHERAFFDSADWALGKQGAQKPKGPLEALRPKLQPTPHQQVRRSAYAPTDEGEGEASADDQNYSTNYTDTENNALDKVSQE